MPLLTGDTATRTHPTPDALASRAAAHWVRDPRVLLVTQSSNWATGTGVYAHRVQDALSARGVTARLVKLSRSFSMTDAAALRTAIDELDPHVVHVLQCRPRHLLRLSRLRDERPLVLTVHNLPPQECKIPFGYSWNRAYLLARNARFAPVAAAIRAALRLRPPTAVVCDSEPVRRQVARILPSGTHLFQCPLGPSRGDSPLPNDEQGETRSPVTQLVTVGAFMFHKGIHRLIHVMAKLKRDGLACRLDILGRRRDPLYFDFVAGLVARDGLEDTVRLLPDVADDAIETALQRAQIYVQPSLEEGFCLTFLDAALKVPCVIGTDVGAIPEIVALRAESASCVPRDSQGALEHSIRRHLKRPAPPPVSQRVHRILSARFSWSAAGTRLLRIYGHVAATRRRRW